jgi:hypothetical protein
MNEKTYLVDLRRGDLAWRYTVSNIGELGTILDATEQAGEVVYLRVERVPAFVADPSLTEGVRT